MSRSRRGIRWGALVLVMGLVVAACGRASSADLTSTTSAATAAGADLDAIPKVVEVSLTGLVDAELELRDGLRESGLAAVLGEDGAGFLERFDADLAEHGWQAISGLADSAGIGPLAGSGLTVALGPVGPLTAAWDGSLQAVSGNFTLSMFMGMVVREWQRLSSSDWSTQGELPANVHDRVVDEIAEHSEIRTTVNGSAAGDELHFEIQVVSEATLTSVSTGEVVANYEATGRGVIDVKGCPDADGIAEGHYTLELEEQAGGSGASAGGSTTIDGPFQMLDGDDAHLIKTDFEGALDSAGSGIGPSGDPFDWSVQSTYPISIPAGGGLDIDESNATYQETAASGDRGQRATAGLILMAANFLTGVAQEAERFWRSGKCVDLTTSDESRKVDPSEEVNFEVTATHHFDTEEIEAPITASFSGTDKIDPTSGTPVDPPVSFTYTAGSEPGDKGSIKLEQKSKRGIGKKTIEFEVALQQVRVIYAGTYRFADSISELRWEGDVLIGGGRGETTALLTLTSEALLLTLCPSEVSMEVPVTVTATVDEADPELFRLSMAPPPPPDWDLTSCEAAAQMSASSSLSGWAAGLQGPVEVRMGETVNVFSSILGVSAEIRVMRAEQ